MSLKTKSVQSINAPEPDFIGHEERRVIKPRRNSVPGTASVRGCVVEEFHGLGYMVWAEVKGYGDRWMEGRRIARLSVCLGSAVCPGFC